MIENGLINFDKVLYFTLKNSSIRGRFVKLDETINTNDLGAKYTNTLVDISEHQLINGRVIGMNERDVLIDIGFKSEGIIDRSEFTDESLPAIGDQVEVYLEYLEDSSGNTILSKEKADFMLRWQNLREAYDNEEIITGKIIRRIKGGMIVDLGVVQAFLPGSQLDVRPITDFDIYVDKVRAKEWDDAAGQAIAEAAGAIVTSLDGETFLYGKEDYKNPTILIRRSENLNA